MALAQRGTTRPTETALLDEMFRPGLIVTARLPLQLHVQGQRQYRGWPDRTYRFELNTRDEAVQFAEVIEELVSAINEVGYEAVLKMLKGKVKR